VIDYLEIHHCTPRLKAVACSFEVIHFKVSFGALDQPTTVASQENSMQFRCNGTFSSKASCDVACELQMRRRVQCCISLYPITLLYVASCQTHLSRRQMLFQQLFFPDLFWYNISFLVILVICLHLGGDRQLSRALTQAWLHSSLMGAAVASSGRLCLCYRSGFPVYTENRSNH
jgi:hypothetical protein